MATPDDVTISLPAMEAKELLAKPTPEGVWLRKTGTMYGMGAEDVEIRGPKDAVLTFIADHWGDEEANYQHRLLIGLKEVAPDVWVDEAAEHARTVADDEAWHHEANDG
jgi:hypothetical protein